MSEPKSTSYPVLPLRDIVVFPHMIVPLFVGREKSVRALEEVMQDDKQILLSSQIDPSVDDPGSDGIYRVGVLANVLQLLKLPDGTVKVLVEGKTRVKITEFVENPSYFEARVGVLSETPGDTASVEAMLRAVAHMRVKACSAVEMVLPVGVFITMTPWALAASRSMLSTPTPARPTALSLVAAAKTSAVTLVWERTTRAS